MVKTNRITDGKPKFSSQQRPQNETLVFASYTSFIVESRDDPADSYKNMQLIIEKKHTPQWKTCTERKKKGDRDR